MISLYTYEDNAVCYVKSAPDVPLLASLGIFSGAKIFKKSTFKQGGPALIVIGSREVAIGKEYACIIEVERCEG